MNFAAPQIVAEHRQAAQDAQTAICTQELAAALLRNVQYRPRHLSGRVFSKLYHDTPERAQWRDLMAAAARIPGVLMAVTFVKDGGEVRTMLCQPFPAEAEYTKRYALVWDVDAAGFRRVNLDAIVKVSMETGAVDTRPTING